MQISQQTIHLHLTTPSASVPLRVSQQALQFHVTSPSTSAPLRISQQTFGVHFMPAVAPILRVALPETTLRLACVGPPGTEGPPGPPGEPGPSGDAPLLVATATTAIGGHRAVVLVGDGSQGAIYADQSIPDHAERFVGVTTGAADSGSPVTIQIGGEITEPSWNWIPGFPVYLSVQGLLTQTPPTTGFLQIIGISLSATRLSIQAQSAFHFE